MFISFAEIQSSQTSAAPKYDAQGMVVPTAAVVPPTSQNTYSQPAIASPTPQPVYSPVSTVTPAAQPSSATATPYAAAAGYNGNSVADFLKAAGQPTDYNSRAALAQTYGITNYSGTAAQNTQLLGILKAKATGNVNNLGVPNNISQTSNATTTPTPTTPIDASALSSTNGSDLNSILKASIQNGTIDSQTAGLLALSTASTQADQQYQDVLNQLTSTMGKLGNQGTDLQSELETQGVPQATQQLKETSLKLAQLQGSIQAFDAETLKGLDNLQGQKVAQGFIDTDKAAYQKGRDLQKLAMTAEFSATASLAQAYQGNIELGTKLAHDAVDMKYQPILTQIDVLKTQLGAAKDNMSVQDGRTSNVINALLTIKQNDIQVQKDKAKQVQTLAIQAASAGAPLSVVQAMQAATDPVQAASIGNKFLHATGESTDGGGNTSNDYITNKETDQSVRKIIAQNPGEYGNAATAIDKQFGPGTASKYDIWLRAVYNEGQPPDSLKVTSTLKGGETTKPKFTTTQSNNGAQNAGLGVEEFKGLDTDVQNFFVNGNNQAISAFNDVIQGVQQGTEDPEQVINEIKTSNLANSVKNYLIERIRSATPQDNGNNNQPGFFGKIWNGIKDLSGGG